MVRKTIKITVQLYRFSNSELKKDGKKEKKEIVAVTPDSVKLLLKDGH